MGAVPAQKATGERAGAADRAVPSEAATARIAVLMPAFNADDTIRRAVESLLNNTYPCDIFVVDDGSTRPVAQILDGLPRTEIIRLEKNVGVVKARNVGVAAILQRPYEFLACLDADDTSYPDRLAKQVAFLDDHPDVAVVGTWARFVDQDSGSLAYTGHTPESPERVRRAMSYNSAVIHTSAMIRTCALKAVGSYSDRYPVAEDYELFRRISQKYAIANVPDVLVEIRLSKGGLSLTRRRRQLFDRLAIQLKYFRPGQIGAYLGLLKTTTLFFVPNAVVRKIKSILQRW